MATEQQITAALDAFLTAREASLSIGYCIKKAIEAAEAVRVPDPQIPTVCTLCREAGEPMPQPPFKIAYCAKHEEAFAV